ncbi:hypothetical protein CPB84DRAFT_1749722 [Gymnopilus junonius]|uniref:Uncharacterized protein n=1 Tax=Gymnopilus junonius TaxID=109634 RepID=A0A9P5NHW8_GYMJU|nr:hypothetical protein CPB84DRAFT_1749722 [Gymnopilus junonius]
MPSATGLSSMEGSTSFSCSLDIQKKILEVAQLPSTITLNAHPTLYVVQREPEYAPSSPTFGDRSSVSAPSDPQVMHLVVHLALGHVLKSIYINGVPSQRPRINLDSSTHQSAEGGINNFSSTRLFFDIWSNDEGPLESRSNFGVTTILRTPIIQVLPSTQHSFQSDDSHPYINIAPTNAMYPVPTISMNVSDLCKTTQDYANYAMQSMHALGSMGPGGRVVVWAWVGIGGGCHGNLDD